MRLPVLAASPALAPLAVLLLAFAAPLRAGDTTYSETRAVPRESPGPAYSGGASAQDRESDADCHPDFDPDCDADDGVRLDFGGDLLENFVASHISLVTGDADMQALADGPWRLGFGFGMGALRAPGAIAGAPFNVHAEALRALAETRQLRLRVAAFGALAGPLADYERTILVDGIPVGVQRDHLSAYLLSGYSLTLEGLWSNVHGLYLAAGGGALALREWIEMERSVVRTSTFPASDVRRAIRPMVSLGVGRWASRGGGRRFQRFEIRYQAAFLLPDRRSSFPGDNAEVLHGLAWDWSWLW